MRGLAGLSGDDQGFFGPGTDLVLSLVAVLLLVVGVLNASFRDLEQRHGELQASSRQREADREEIEDLNRRLRDRLGQLEANQKRMALDIEVVRRNQLDVVHSIAATFGTEPRPMMPDVYGFHVDPGGDPDIVIENNATLQRIRFGGHVLFETDEYELLPGGERVLRNFAQALRAQLGGIEEIQLQGHADIRKTGTYDSNLVLASLRAIEVFNFLQSRGVDPTRHLMSATSFGEYVPVARRGRTHYDSERLEADNDTQQKMALNRRIEVILIYELAPSHSPTPTSTRSTLR